MLQGRKYPSLQTMPPSKRSPHGCAQQCRTLARSSETPAHRIVRRNGGPLARCGVHAPGRALPVRRLARPRDRDSGNVRRNGLPAFSNHVAVIDGHRPNDDRRDAVTYGARRAALIDTALTA